jgi:hypothetical protein
MESVSGDTTVPKKEKEKEKICRGKLTKAQDVSQRKR